jgi:hypothetical protein
MTRPTGFSPNEFMSSVEEMGGLSRRNRYSMSITPPTTFSVPTGKIDFLAMSCLLPSKQFATTENRMYGFSKNIPYDVTYEPILVTFLNPNDWSTRKFWDEWLDYIQNPSSFNMQYYSKCTGTVEISVFDEENTSLSDTPRYTAVLQEAWPERMSAYALGYENSDLGNFEISIRYQQWYEKGTNRHEKAADAGSRNTFTTTTHGRNKAELATNLSGTHKTGTNIT